MLHEGSRKVGPLRAFRGHLPGIVATGGRRQVMFTLLRQELPKGFNQAFESAPAPSPKITTRAVYLIHRSQVPLAFISLQFSLLCPSWQDSLSQGFLETWLHPSSARPLPVGPPVLSTIPIPLPRGFCHQSLLPPPRPALLDSPDPLQPVCLLTASQTHTLSIL